MIDQSNINKNTSAIRLFGVSIPMSKNLVSGLPMIYGVGKRNLYDICAALSLNPRIRFYQLSQDQVDALRRHIEANYVIEGDLKSRVVDNIKRLISLNCYRGMRHRRGLPVRGQRTKTNARTRRGRKKQAIAQKKQPVK